MHKLKEMRDAFRRRFDRLVMWFWSRKHPCRIGWKEYDHELTYVDDSFDYEGPFGLSTHNTGHWECERCGYAPEEQDGPPVYDDWY